ncbi:response regulator [Myxococcus xanthus]|nr:Regulator of RpoS [Myxococcus xanthus]SDW22524.1 protein of unknown function [Myxococcus xanthus]
MHLPRWLEHPGADCLTLPFASGTVRPAMAPRILVVDDNQELLSLLTQLFEEAGYEVIGASRGKQAVELAKAQPPAAAVLDILLPDMMGYHLADALRKDNPQLPLLFITGVFKGGKHAVEARTKYQAAGYFEKPFEAQKLLEAMTKVLPPEKPAAAAASLQDAFEVELDIDVEEEGPQDAMELTGRIKVTGGGNITAEIRGANLTASPMQKVPATQVRPPTPGRPPDPPPAGAPGSRRGEIRDNLPSLLTAFYLSRETGELGVQKGKVKKVVYFEKGTPVFALSNLLADRFGQFLVRVGKIKPEQLQDASAVAAQSNRRTGDVLVERGLLKDTERLYYVGQQVKAVIYSLFAWDEGTYVLSFREKASAESIKLDVHPANLIVRGIKKLYKPERLRRLLQPEDRLIPAVAPAYQLNEVELERWEAELLPKIDGNRTVAELLAFANRPEHVVYGFLVAMMSLGILDKRG